MIDFSGFETRLAALVPDPLTDIHDESIAGLHTRWCNRSPSVEDVVIVYHGGGAMIDGGYEQLGTHLCRSGDITACLVDIRGHGHSPGPRGQAPSPMAAWDDVATVVTAARKRYPSARVHLLGHSSGAGLILNAITRRPDPPDVTSIILLAPELGPFLPGKKAHADPDAFATARLWPFVINAMSGGRLCRHTLAVTLNYPKALANKGFVTHYGVAMAQALTPSQPVAQLSRLKTPTLVCLAGRDDLLPNDLLTAAIASASNPNIGIETSPQSTHLGILLDDTTAITDWMARTARLS
ncbi:MAG: lysophospholipase [Acidobacteriaceae bacterium]|jgi:alpha-beta hydrolase superfamily lysophospholipase|nr:lysophospholipase [Acidobacteriaceae bacterium]